MPATQPSMHAGARVDVRTAGISAVVSKGRGADDLVSQAWALLGIRSAGCAG
jgi:hypothetical protein